MQNIEELKLNGHERSGKITFRERGENINFGKGGGE
jgi:hypothetical protein